MKKITLLTLLILFAGITECSSGNKKESQPTNKKESQPAANQQNGENDKKSNACDIATKAYKSCYYSSKYGKFAAYIPGLSAVAGMAGRCNLSRLQLAQTGACLLKK